MIIREKIKHVIYGTYRATVWRFLGKGARRKKNNTYKKYREIIDTIEEYFNNSNEALNKDAQKVVEHVKKKGIENVFPYDYVQKYYLLAAISINYDKKNKMYYAIRGKKRLYLKQRTYQEAIHYYWNLLHEQDENSPHLYTEKKINGDILLDVGAAEGFFSLDHLHDFNKIFIFESDTSWIPALKVTFREFDQRVFIIEKSVGELNDDKHISLDMVIKQFNIKPTESVYVKIDVEGAEMSVLKGAHRLLEGKNDTNIFVCTYHKQNDEEELLKEINRYKEFHTSNSKGYMIMFYTEDIDVPYLRRGVLRASRVQQKN